MWRNFGLTFLLALSMLNGSEVEATDKGDGNDKQSIRTVAEVVWASTQAHSSNDQITRELLYSSYDGESWSTPISLYESPDPLVTPSIFSIDDSRKMLVWSELRGRKTLLMYKEQINQMWQAEAVLSDIGVENLGASLAMDANNQLHVFWSAHQNDNDDIYHSRFNGQWSQAKRVHEPNLVPDYAPNAELDDEGGLQVFWKSYSPLSMSYQLASRVIVKEDKPVLKIDLSGNDDTQLSDIIEPNFLPTNALHVIHFPYNRRIKNVRINDF